MLCVEGSALLFVLHVVLKAHFRTASSTDMHSARSIVSPVRSQRDALNTRVSATQFEFLVTWLKRGFHLQVCRIFYLSFSEDQISTYYQAEFNCFCLSFSQYKPLKARSNISVSSFPVSHWECQTLKCGPKGTKWV